MSYAAMDGSATQFAGQNGYMPACGRARDDESRRARDDEDDDDDATRSGSYTHLTLPTKRS